MDEKKKSVDVWKRIRIVVVGLVVIAGLLCWHYRDPETAKFVAYLIGGGLLLWQVQTSSQRAKAAEETAKAMQKTANSTEKGSIAERFKNAIEHLGNESASVRLGGIYALHHIAQDVEEYRKRVFEILCAHIRETTTQDGYEPLKRPYLIEEYKLGGLIPLDGGKWLTIDKVVPTMEIQSILKLLFVEHVESEIYNQFTVDLAGANLQGATLIEIKQGETVGVKWKNADLTYTNLKDAVLDYADLESAWIASANLQKTSLQGANLKNAYLDHSNARETNFTGADLQGCNFYDTNLQEAELVSTKNLTTEQLLKAKTLYSALFPEGMEADIERHNYKLLEKPKLDNEPDA